MQRLLFAWRSLAQYGGVPWRARTKTAAAASMPAVGAMK
jgi:hypothetical protein